MYESTNCQRSYRCAFMQTSENCSECFFGLNLRGCKHCFGCVNLQQKEYYILNKPHSKEEYFQKLKEFDTGSYKKIEKFKTYFQHFIKQFPRKFSNLKHCEDCSGDHLYNCKNVHNSIDVMNGFECRFFDRGDGPEWCYDIIQSGKPSWCYDSITPDNSWMCAFTLWCWKSKNILYSDNCHSCTDCFGCISLRHKQYCIFNKQYSKKEYEEKTEEIVSYMQKTKEWGTFFPIEISPFPYNKTLANTYFPLTKKEVLAQHWKWEDDKKKDEESYPLTEIPNDITNTTDSICKKILLCKECGKNYKIQKSELKFYKKLNLPLPGKCPDCRHLDRTSLRNPRKLFDRKCDNCNTSIQTTFSPKQPEKVFCEKCYLDCIE